MAATSAPASSIDADRSDILLDPAGLGGCSISMKVGLFFAGVFLGLVCALRAAELAPTEVRARLVGPDDRPVVEATVEPHGVSVGTGTSWGGTQGFPEKVLTDTNGEFALSRAKPFTRVQAQISATGLAPLNVWLEPTGGVTTVRLDIGATVQGRLLKDRQALAGVRLGVAGSERRSEVFAGHYETTTHDDGTFRFAHLPPNTSWSFYPIISSIKARGSVHLKSVRSGDNGETTDMGDVAVEPALHLAGQVKTRHGEPLPANFKIRLGYDKAWDSEGTTVDAEGKFRFDGLSDGLVEVSLQGRGWRLSPANRSMDPWNAWQLTGLLETSKEDLLLVVEPGELEFSGGGVGNGELPPQDWPQARPLAGAEPSGPPPIVLAGRVLDDKTGQPVTSYTVVPGYKPPRTGMPTPPGSPLQRVLEPFKGKTVPFNERPYWLRFGAETLTNSAFAVEFLPLSSTPLLRIEAQGYHVFETEPIPQTTSNLVIRLKRGNGPNGIVLLPDGKPAEGATVVYTARGGQLSLDGKSLSNYGEKQALQVTGKDGRFSFSDRPQGLVLFVSHASGWAEESVEKGGDNLKVKLQPWAVLSGTLVDSNGVAKPGVTLDLTMPRDWQRDEPFVNFQGAVKTDAQGRFQFVAVPPRRLEVNRRIPMGTTSSGVPQGWTYQKQTWVVAQPGITNDLGKVIYDQPPPAPIVEQIKQKLGL